MVPVSPAKPSLAVIVQVPFGSSPSKTESRLSGLKVPVMPLPTAHCELIGLPAASSSKMVLKKLSLAQLPLTPLVSLIKPTICEVVPLGEVSVMPRSPTQV